MDSDRFQKFRQLQAYSTGILWILVDSGGFHKIPMDSVLLEFIPSDSSRFHWIPVDTKDSTEVQSGCVWKSKVQVEWDKIEPEVCQNLIESVPRRMEAVIKAKGGYTKY